MKAEVAKGTALFFLLSGCLSVRTQTQKVAPQERGIAVIIFPKDAARRNRRPGPEGVRTELKRKEGALKVPLGTYHLSFPARSTQEGHMVSKGEAVVDSVGNKLENASSVGFRVR